MTRYLLIRLRNAFIWTAFAALCAGAVFLVLGSH